MSTVATTTVPSPDSTRAFLLQRVQPAMTGVIDGSLSTLAPSSGQQALSNSGHPVQWIDGDRADADGALRHSRDTSFNPRQES